MGKNWTVEEEEILKRDYKKSGSKLVHKWLPHRTREAIRNRAQKMEATIPSFWDLTGEIYNSCLVLRTFRENKITYCECECHCGNIFITRASSLKNDHTKSCGHCNDIYDGDRFGLGNRVEVICYTTPHIDPKSGSKFPRCICLCSCGNIFIAHVSSLKSGNTKSCGCYNKERVRETHFKDLSGQRFSRLFVKGLDRIEDRKSYWVCICDCGRRVTALRSNLISGATKSCGCLQKELMSVRTGENNPAWKGGITPLYKRIRNSLKYTDLLKACLKRDNYTCQYSGEVGGTLNMHHIVPFAAILEKHNITTYEEAMECEELWDLDNVITLSEKYHMAGPQYDPNSFHNKFGLVGCTKGNFLGWLSSSLHQKPIP